MSNKGKGAGSSGPPAVCLLHLNFEPCPWCEPEPEPEPETPVERALDLLKEVEAAVIDTVPRKRRLRN